LYDTKWPAEGATEEPDMKKLLNCIAVLLPLALPGALGAAEVYVGGGVGDDVTESATGAGFAEFEGEAADDSRKYYLGVGLGDHFALEGSYYDFGERTCCPGLADAGFASSLEGWSVAAVGRLPFGRYGIFGKVGVLQWEEVGDLITIAGPQPFTDDGSDPLVGVGASVLLLEHVAARLEWESFDLGESSADTVWVLLEIRF
jgi:hypothetical protein